MTPFENLIFEISKTQKERKAIRYKRKLNYYISTEKLHYLYTEYFLQVIDEEYYQSFFYRDEDFPALLVILRYHFKVWIEFDDRHKFIDIYKNFPQRFELIKQVNKQMWKATVMRRV